MLPRITCLLSALFLMPLLTAHGAADMAAISVSFPVRTHGISMTKTELMQMLTTSEGKMEDGGVHISLDPGDSFDALGNVKDEGDIVIEAGDVNGCNTIKKFLEDHRGVVHIVRSIPCCDKPRKDLVGCSGLGMAILVLPQDQQKDIQLRAVEWMHELGHNKGLCHSECSANALMSSNPLGAGDTDLDSCEQHVFNGGHLSDLQCTQTQPQNCRQMDCNDNTQATVQRQVK
jgi:hypothetical protein